MEDILHSIIIPTYNRADILLDAVASAKQSMPPKSEIIVVNDGNALSASVSEFLQLNDVVYLETRKATGAGAARNFGVNAARGNWIFFLDDDDMIAPNYWKSVVGYISKHLTDKDAAYGFCQSKSFSNRASMKKFYEKGSFEFSIRKAAEGGLKPKLAGLGVGFWVSKKLFVNVGGMSESIKVNEDTDFCLRLLAAGASCHTANNVGALVFSGSNDAGNALSTTKSATARQRMAYFHAIIEAHEKLLGNDKKTAYWLFKRYVKMAGRGRSIDAITQLLRSKLLSQKQKAFLTIYFFFELLISFFKK